MAIKFENIGYGAKGIKVKEIKRYLKKAGSGVKQDSVFDIGTVAAVRAFQKKNGLPVTGIVDKKTFAKLAEVKPVKKTAKK